MLEITIPPDRRLQLHTLMLDVNGTLATDGHLLDGVAARLAALRPHLHIVLVSADTHGTLDAVAQTLGVTAQRLAAGDGAAQKGALLAQLGPEQTAAIGNGVNDVAMLRGAALGIAVLGQEGLASACLLAADVVAPDIAAALDLLLHPRRLVATLRG